MPFGGFLAAGIIGGVGSIVGGAIQAGAQSDIAEAQAEASRQMREQALGFAKPTVQELDNLKKQVDLYSKMYAQQSAVLDQATKQLTDIYGPAIMEQGKQYYAQLQGEASGVVKSYDSQRNRQRDQLKQQLIDRMGPDALTSSAGTQALNQFDMQTSEQRTTIEENSLNGSLNRLLGASSGQSGISQMINQSYSGLSGLLNNIGTTLGNFQTRQANAAVNTSSAVIQSAGAGSVGQAYLGQAIQGGFQQAGQLAGQGMMMGALRGPASTPQPTPTPPSGGGFGSGQGTFGQFNPQSPLGGNDFQFGQMGN